METNDIREAILSKAKGEAGDIIAGAQKRAHEMTENAKEERKKLFEDTKKKIIDRANQESAKILAQASLKERQTVLSEKDAVIKEVLAKVRDELAGNTMGARQIELLINETIEAFETDQPVRLLVAAKDLTLVQEYIKGNDSLKEKVAEIKETACLGGILGETMDGMVSIDNTFDMRLDMLIPKILPEIGKTLFGS